MPRPLIYAVALLVPLAVMPFAIIALVQARLSDQPRIAPLQDMGIQPKLKAQALDPFFADRRAQRMPVAGTVARGQLAEDDFFNRGYTQGPVLANPASKKPEPAWFDSYPPQVRVTEALLHRGQERFNIYCAICHGEAGYGDGMVHRRAQALLAAGQTTGWQAPSNLHEQRIVEQPNGRLFNTITNGNPGGFMPPYGGQIPIEDRWAIIAYLRALQRSQAAKPTDVPADKRAEVRN